MAHATVADELYDTALKTSYINRTVIDACRAALPDAHIAALQSAAADRAMALICTRTHCLPPVFEASEIRSLMKEAVANT